MPGPEGYGVITVVKGRGCDVINERPCVKHLLFVILVFAFNVSKISKIFQEISLVFVVGFSAAAGLMVGVVIVKGTPSNDVKIAGTQNLVLNHVVLVVHPLGGVPVIGVWLYRLLGIGVAVVLLQVPAGLGLTLGVALVVAALEGSLALPVTWKKIKKKVLRYLLLKCHSCYSTVTCKVLSWITSTSLNPPQRKRGQSCANSLCKKDQPAISWQACLVLL